MKKIYKLSMLRLPREGLRGQVGTLCFWEFRGAGYPIVKEAYMVQDIKEIQEIGSKGSVARVRDRSINKTFFFKVFRVPK